MNINSFVPTIKLNELPKFLLTSFIMIITLYVYSILRSAKDALIVSELGAELISTLKLYGVLPCALLLMLLYIKLADYLTRVQVYHVLNWFFISFFMLFDLVLYPNAKFIHFEFTALVHEYPTLKYVLIMVENWSYSMFYIMSELWGSMMLSLMFWQFANQINSIEEAKRFYSLFGFLGQIGLMAAGILMVAFTTSSFTSDWRTTLHYICFSVLVSGVLLSAILYSIGNYIVGNDVINGTQSKRIKNKPGLIQSLKYILASRYIFLITLLILCYGISINLVEGVWKKQLSILYPETLNYGSFMGKLQIYTAIATFLAMVASSYVLRMLSWKKAALMTPIIILLTGCPFFLFIIYNGLLNNSKMEINILFIAVISGAIQNILSKAIKYSFFDPTKEMAYIPLDEELKSKGKAAAEVIGGRLGKSGGAIIQWSMLSFIVGSSLTSLAPYLFAVFIIILLVWFYAVFVLYTKFKKTVHKSGVMEAAKVAT